MISVADAISMVTSCLSPLSTEWLEAPLALGRVLAKDVASQVTQPSTDVSAMDGYAVRVQDVGDVPTTLEVVGESAAGLAFDGTVERSQAVRISTGAAIPPGADSIVIQENTHRNGNHLTVLKVPVPKKWIRKAGLDFRTGEVHLRAGRVLTARDIGLSAAMNAPWIKVYRKPRIAFLATGNELVLPGSLLRPNQIVSSNSAALAASITVLGGEAVNLGIARDTRESLVSKLRNLEGIDLLITIGGASVGDHDLVLATLKELGFNLHFHKVAMRPGKPMIFGQLGTIPVLGLPGNPVSVGVATAVLLRPAMEVLSGAVRQTLKLPSALLGADLPGNDQRQSYLRARLSCSGPHGLTLTPLSKQDSAILSNFASADCLIIRPPHAPPAIAGDPTEYLSLTHSTSSL